MTRMLSLYVNGIRSMKECLIECITNDIDCVLFLTMSKISITLFVFLIINVQDPYTHNVVERIDDIEC